jgi:RND family efflux transporter MFP subunit
MKLTHLTKSAAPTPFKKFKAISLKKKIGVIVLSLIVLVIIGQVIARITEKPEYTTTTAIKGDVVEIVTETGNIAASGRVDVYSPTNGIVDNVYISNNDYVEEGQELFTVQSSATEQEAQAAYANYLTAVSTLNAAKSNLNVLRSAMYDNWENFRDLATNDTYESGDGKPNTQNREAAEFQIAQDDWLAAEAKYKDQQTVVGQASASVASTWLLYEATQNASIKAPASGIVSNLGVTNGSSVDIKSATLPSAPVLTLSSNAITEVVVALSETDIAKVASNQEATVDVNSVDDKTYKGIVRRVDSIGNEVDGVIRYFVYIEILNPDEKLRSGMNVDVEITTKKVTDVITVPNSAVKPYQGSRAVRVPGDQGEIEYIPVKIGIRGENKTEIMRGIEEGQEVITSLSNEQLQRPGLFGN